MLTVFCLKIVFLYIYVNKMLVCKILVLLSSVVAARLICLILYLSIFLLVNYLASRDRLSLLFAFKNYGYQVGSGFFFEDQIRIRFSSAGVRNHGALSKTIV